MSFVLGMIGVAICVIIILCHLLSPTKLSLEGAHVLITGGSSGIGKALAIEAIQSGANVTILARNQTLLNGAKQDIAKYIKQGSQQELLTVSADLTGDHEVLCRKISQAETKLGPIVMLINCAGTSIAGMFEDVQMSDFRHLMEVNYFGTVNATKAVIKGMKARGRGRIVMVSSQAGQLGIFGFSAYSPSKFALRGLAESLQMEVRPYDIRVTVSFPPDTDTPGYKEEMKTKPKETCLISETSGLFTAEAVAKTILTDAQHGKFLSSVGLDGFMLTNLNCGMTPVTSLAEALWQVATMSVFRAVSFFYLWSFDNIVRRCKNEASISKSKAE